MDINHFPASQLSAAQVMRWRELQQQHPSLHSPYFCVEFTQLVASVRDDVYVAVIEDENHIVGFFPFQRTYWGVGKPVGGMLADLNGIIGESTLRLDPRHLLQACGLVRWEFTHLLADQETFSEHHCKRDISHSIDLTDGFERYLEQLDQRGSKLSKDVAAKYRRMERRLGPVRFQPHVADSDVLDTLLSWKSQQYRRSDLVDIFSFDWTVELLRRIHQTQTAEFSGMLSALFVNDEPAALHLGMRSRSVWNWWFPRHDHRYHRFSPGICLRMEVARCAPDYGVRRIDLGKGDESTYKPRLANGGIGVAEGHIEVPSLATFARRARDATEVWVRQSPLAPLARVPGRLIKRAERWARFR